MGRRGGGVLEEKGGLRRRGGWGRVAGRIGVIETFQKGELREP